jgi:hypothetical protein
MMPDGLTRDIFLCPEDDVTRYFCTEGDHDSVVGG